MFMIRPIKAMEQNTEDGAGDGPFSAGRGCDRRESRCGYGFNSARRQVALARLGADGISGTGECGESGHHV